MALKLFKALMTSDECALAWNNGKQQTYRAFSAMSSAIPKYCIELYCIIDANSYCLLERIGRGENILYVGWKNKNQRFTHITAFSGNEVPLLTAPSFHSLSDALAVERSGGPKQNFEEDLAMALAIHEQELFRAFGKNPQNFSRNTPSQLPARLPSRPVPQAHAPSRPVPQAHAPSLQAQAWSAPHAPAPQAQAQAPARLPPRSAPHAPAPQAQAPAPKTNPTRNATVQIEVKPLSHARSLVLGNALAEALAAKGLNTPTPTPKTTPAQLPTPQAPAPQAPAPQTQTNSVKSLISRFGG